MLERSFPPLPIRALGGQEIPGLPQVHAGPVGKPMIGPVVRKAEN